MFKCISFYNNNKNDACGANWRRLPFVFLNVDWISTSARTQLSTFFFFRFSPVGTEIIIEIENATIYIYTCLCCSYTTSYRQTTCIDFLNIKRLQHEHRARSSHDNPCIIFHSRKDFIRRNVAHEIICQVFGSTNNLFKLFNKHRSIRTDLLRHFEHVNVGHFCHLSAFKI